MDARDAGRDLESALTEPRFVPESIPVDELLAEFQTGRIEMVVVVDEFGSVVGIATFEDLVEEVVGEIVGRNETDPIRMVDETTAIAAGWATVAYVNETLGTELPFDGDFDTLAGLIHATVGRFPEEDDRIQLGSAVVTVLDTDGTRLRRVRIERVEPDDL